MVDFFIGRRWSGRTVSLAGSALFPLSFVGLLLNNSFHSAIALPHFMASPVALPLLPTQHCLSSYSLPVLMRCIGADGCPLELTFAAVPPAFAAMMTSAGPQAALWLAFFISIFALITLLWFGLLHNTRHP
ncbi:MULTISPECIES: hypothetical protein [Bradyrhizobium]|uniref:hypothetical protein n=1 Tax=Bradyrhizobium elkanii TaxID=29448 RepID=UPI0018AD4D0E|nr:hypothetical protein [Bradyrhizobium elkanii]